MEKIGAEFILDTSNAQRRISTLQSQINGLKTRSSVNVSGSQVQAPNLSNLERTLNNLRNTFSNISFGGGSSGIASSMSNNIQQGIKDGFSVGDALITGFAARLGKKVGSSIKADLTDRFKSLDAIINKYQKQNPNLAVGARLLRIQTKDVFNTMNSLLGPKLFNKFDAWSRSLMGGAGKNAQRLQNNTPLVDLASKFNLINKIATPFVNIKNSILKDIGGPLGLFGDLVKNNYVQLGILAAALATASTSASLFAAALPIQALGAARPYLDSFAEITRKQMALTSMGGNIGQAEQLAKLPGVSRMGSYSASVGLMATGFLQSEASKIIEGFSKGVSASGGGQQDLEGVLFALKQMASKGFVSAEEVNQQISERLPSFRKTMEKVFGTQDLESINSMATASEFISRMADEYSKLDSALDSPSNKLEIFDDSVQKMKENLGKGLMTVAGPAIENLNKLIDEAVSSGNLERLGEAFGAAFNTETIENFASKLPTIIDTMERLTTSSVNFLNKLASGIDSVLVLIDIVSSAMNVLSPLAGAGKGIVDLIGKIAGGGGPNKEVEAYQKKLLENGGQKKIDDMMARQRAAQEARSEKKQKELMGEKKPTDMLATFLEENLKYQREIAQNTKQRPDIQRMILGGGDLGANGVSLSTLSQTTGRSSGRYGKIASVIQEVIKDEVSDTLRELSYKGVF